MTASAVLLGDIGATNARFALLTDGLLGPVKWIAVARYPQFADAIEDILQDQFRERLIENARFAVAGPVEGERCNFTNCSWTVDGAEMRDRFDLQTVRIINDFEATALSLPHLMEGDVRSLGGGHAVAGAPMVVLGPGSGLGVAGLVGDDARRNRYRKRRWTYDIGRDFTPRRCHSRSTAPTLRPRFGRTSTFRTGP